YTWSGYLLMLARDIPGAIAASEYAVELIGRHGPPVLLTRALNALGAARWFTEPGLAEQTLRWAAEAARAAGDDAGTGWGAGHPGPRRGTDPPVHGGGAGPQGGDRLGGGPRPGPGLRVRDRLARPVPVRAGRVGGGDADPHGGAGSRRGPADQGRPP